MRDIGIREMKAHASEIVRRVWKDGERFLITVRGRPVGLLVPLESPLVVSPSAAGDGEAVWQELTRLGEEIAASWNSSQTSADLLSEMR